MLQKILVALLCFFLFLPADTSRAQSQNDIVAGMIQERLQDAPVSGGLSVGTCQVSSLRVLPELYKRRGYRPIWVNAQSMEQLVHAIEETYEDGLDPQDYHLEEIRQQAMGREGPSPDPALAAARDLLLTDAFIRLANHSNCGKEDPISHHPQWNLDRKIGGTDPVAFIEKAIEEPSITQTVNSWKIRHPYYSRLKAVLARYRAIRDRGGWELVPGGPTLKRGMIDPRVLTLRRRLAVTDTLEGAVSDPMTFDGNLAQALRGFQHRHGLKEDGMAGKGTLEALNLPVEERIDQIRVNLERARWVLRDLGDTYVLVDIAGFRVFFQKDDRIIWSCKAQVGQPYRDTPVFKSDITSVELNPSWVVPPSILEKDVLPAVQKDPGYLKKHDITVFDSKGGVVNPKNIDWSRYPRRPFPYTLRQKPGAGSALGRIKISFPNEYLVYLHDTPHKELFEREDRTFSSGCIRLEKPFELAELLLDDPSRWGMGNIMKAVESGKTQRVSLPRPVSILLLYWTVEVDEGGSVYFKKDPYHQDTAVLLELGRDSDISHREKTQP
jgi:L,D-transpeptidase YcbB